MPSFNDNFWWILYGIVGVLATALTAGITPVCRTLSWKFSILDRPLKEKHKQHSDAMPILGGIAMFLGWGITIFLGILGVLLYRSYLPVSVSNSIKGMLHVSGLLSIIILGAFFMTLLGYIDDRKNLSAFTKFTIQCCICSIVALYPKLRITLFLESSFLTWSITVFWFMFMINAFNFFDNMDGLAAGIACIAALIFTVIAGYRQQFFVASLGAVTTGCSLGFYFHNCSPASIFMGDSGSHLLGYLLAILGILTSFYRPDQSPTIIPIFIPILVLAVPIYDTLAVMIIRIKKGLPVYAADHNHISHRFCRMGINKKMAVHLVHLLSIAVGLGALSLLWLDEKGVVVVIIQTIAILSFVSLLHTIR